MIRLVDASAAVREAFPGAYADLAVAVTSLGSPTVLVFVLATLYWFSPRRRETALVISYAVAGMALLVGLKALIGLPRPPAELFLVDADGYGFPSGHAFAATVVYGGLASAFGVGRRPAAAAAVAILVALVGLSRVVLGVHYLGDVVAAVALGVAFLVAMNRVTGGDPRGGFAVAGACSVAALVVAGPSDDLALAAGGAVGGFAASRRIEALPALESRRERGALLAVGSLVAVAGLALETVAGAVGEALVASDAPALAGGYALLVWAILLAPALGRSVVAFPE